MRAFIAIELPNEVADALKDLQRRLGQSGLKARWVRAENIHLTLKFLGDIASHKLEAISGAMKSVADRCAPFTLSAAGLGVFPRLKKARVLWAGLSEGVAELIELQQDLDTALSTCGFEREKKAFRGHLTLARFRKRVDPGKLQSSLQELGGIRIGQWTVTDLILFQSELRPSGAVYTRQVTHPLAR